MGQKMRITGGKNKDNTGNLIYKSTCLSVVFKYQKQQIGNMNGES